MMIGSPVRPHKVRYKHYKIRWPLANQERSQEFVSEGEKLAGGLGDGRLSVGSRGKASMGVWGRSPQKLKTC